MRHSFNMSAQHCKLIKTSHELEAELANISLKRYKLFSLLHIGCVQSHNINKPGKKMRIYVEIIKGMLLLIFNFYP